MPLEFIVRKYRDSECVINVLEERKGLRMCSTQCLKLVCQDQDLPWPRKKEEISLMKFMNQALLFAVPNIYVTDICSE